MAGVSIAALYTEAEMNRSSEYRARQGQLITIIAARKLVKAVTAVTAVTAIREQTA